MAKLKAVHPKFRQALSSEGFSPAGEEHMLVPEGMSGRQGKSLAHKVFGRVGAPFVAYYRCRCGCGLLGSLPTFGGEPERVARGAAILAEEEAFLAAQEPGYRF